MYTEEQLEEFYHLVINAAVALNSQYILNQRDFNNPALIEARERLRDVCNKNSLKMIIIPDGDDAVLEITTIDHTLVLMINMNYTTFESEE